MKYARIIDNAVAEVREMASNFDPQDVAHKFDFRLLNRLPDPAFDPATQRLADVGYTINPDSVDGVAAVVALTQEEIDARAAAAADAAELEQIKAFYLDLKNGVGTQAVRLARVEKGLAWVLRYLFRQAQV